MTVEQHQQSGALEIISPARGFVAGLGAAAVMAVVLLTGSAVAGRGFLTPLNAIGGLFAAGSTPVVGWARGTTLLGLAIHLLTGGVLGALYASAQEAIDRRSLLVVAVYFGLVVWIVANFAVLSWLKPSLGQAMRTWPVLVGHLAYGATLGLYAATKLRVSGPTPAD